MQADTNGDEHADIEIDLNGRSEPPQMTSRHDGNVASTGAKTQTFRKMRHVGLEPGGPCDRLTVG